MGCAHSSNLYIRARVSKRAFIDLEGESTDEGLCSSIHIDGDRVGLASVVGRWEVFTDRYASCVGMARTTCRCLVVLTTRIPLNSRDGGNHEHQ